MVIDYPIAVVGAGIIGASIAAKLTGLGVPVALIDQGVAGGQGASSYSGGLIRLYDTDPLLMALAARSIDLLDEEPFASAFAGALHRTGLIYRADPAQLERVKTAIAHYSSDRYPMRLLSRIETSRLLNQPDPGANRIDLFEAHAGVGNVRQVTASLAGQVRQRGLLLEHCEVTGMECRSQDEVHLALGNARNSMGTTLRCSAVVIAAGGWSGRWMPEPRIEARSIPLARVHSDSAWDHPMIDAVTQTYGIPLTRHIIQTGCGPRDTACLPEELRAPDARHAADARARSRQLSRSGHHHVLDVLPGLDGYTPDGRPLVGFIEERSPVYLATGLSGVGFKLAPAIAQMAAGQLQARLHQTAIPTGWSELSPTRFMQACAVQQVQP